jgi:ketosteroid isomerase-like protein
MKQSQIVTPAVLTVALAMGPMSGSATEPTDVPHQLIAVDQSMQKAFLTHDVATLDAIFTDDYVLINSKGAEQRKADILREAGDPETRWDVNESSGWQVRVQGDMAIVVAILHSKGTDHGQPFDARVKFSDTYILENGRWRNVHAHASRLAEGSSAGT